jgi:hypothetical protein
MCCSRPLRLCAAETSASWGEDGDCDSCDCDGQGTREQIELCMEMGDTTTGLVMEITVVW